MTRINGATARLNGVVASMRAIRSHSAKASASGSTVRSMDGTRNDDFRLHDLERLSVDLDERRPQRFVPLDDLSEGFFDEFRRQVAFDAPSNRDI